MASFEEWLEAFDEVYRGSSADEKVACPNCGHRTLRLVFTAKPGAEVGYAAFWCETCRQGIHISRTVIPGGAVVRDSSVPIEDREPAIPDYEAVN
jgi:hypothetical protein